jgi:hypothetical protein
MSPSGFGANRFIPFDLDDLRGLDENENPHLIPTKSLTVASNVWRLGRSVGTRPGMIRDPDNNYDAAISGGPTICGIADFRRTRNSARTLVVVVPGAIHTSDTATLTLGAGVVVTNTAELPWVFAQHKNKLFAAGGDVGVGDTAWYWDGSGNPTRLGILNNAAANIEPRYIFSFANRLWAGGFTGTDPSGNPGIVRYSALNDGLTWPIENTVGGNNSVGGFAADDEEFVTGIGRFKNDQGRWLLVQTNRRLYPLHESLDPRRVLEGTDEVAVGCVGQAAFVDLGVDAGDAIFVSDEGIHSLMESQKEGNDKRRYLSWPIRRTFRTLNRSRAAYVVSAPWREHGLALFTFPTGSNTENDTMLVLDLKDSGERVTPESAIWFKWTLGSPVSYLAPGRDASGNPQLYWGDYDGNVGVFSTSTYADLGSAFSVRFRTKFSDFNASTASKVLGDIYVDIGVPNTESAYAVNFQPVFDFGKAPGESFPILLEPGGQFVLDVSRLDIDALGEGETIFHTKLFGGGKFYTCGFEVSNSSLNRPFYIHRIAGEVAVDGESAQDEAA